MSRYARAAADGAPEGYGHTLAETERAVADRLTGLMLDMQAMAVVQNVYRAASTIRNHLERTVLAQHDLTWMGWVVLWVVWIWGDIESRHAATEAGISKGTLTGVVGTLQARGLVNRRVHPEDARRALLSLTPEGAQLMTELFPQFNKEESAIVGCLDSDQQQVLARSLRQIITRLDGADPA